MTDSSTKKRAPVVALRGDIDVAVADDVLEQITSAAGEDRTVTVDLSAVTFMDSSGISALLRANDAVELRLAEVAPCVERLLGTVGLSDHFPRA